MEGNSVEEAAIKVAIRYERAMGRNPMSVERKGFGYDIESGGLKIEVKGRGRDKEPHVLMNENNINALEKSGDEYRLYVVMNPLNNPKIIEFRKEDVRIKKEEKRQWRIPLRKEDFDRGIKIEK